MSAVKITVWTNRNWSHVDSITKTVEANSHRLSYDTARGIAAGYRRRVHVITGNLRRSVAVERVRPGRHKVKAGATYAAYEEYGTRYRPGHPAFRPAVEEMRLRLRVNGAREIFTHR